MTRSFACTVDSAQKFLPWTRLRISSDHVTCPIPACCAIFSGPIPIPARRYVPSPWYRKSDTALCSHVARPSVIQGWGDNDRGVSFTFGGDVVRQFLRRHDLDLVVRAHQVVEDGYEFFAGRELVTVFSAPNYCGEFDNAGAMMTVDDTLMCSFQILKPASASQQRGGYGRQNSPGNRGGR
jgi:hypothetical protein